MIKKIVTIALLTVSLVTFSQGKTIEFKVEKNDADKALLVYGYNNTSSPLQITLTIKDIKMLKGYTKPITKVVPPKSKEEFIKLTFEYDFYTYKLSYTYKKLDSDVKKKITAFNKKDYYLKDTSKMDEGIVVFTDEGCGNCRLVTNYLVGNDMDFKIVDLSQGKKNVSLMWKTIKEKKANMKVKLPVIVVDGKLSHSHKDWKGFLERLKK